MKRDISRHQIIHEWLIDIFIFTRARFLNEFFKYVFKWMIDWLKKQIYGGKMFSSCEDQTELAWTVQK